MIGALTFVKRKLPANERVPTGAVIDSKSITPRDYQTGKPGVLWCVLRDQEFRFALLVTER